MFIAGRLGGRSVSTRSWWACHQDWSPSGRLEFWRPAPSMSSRTGVAGVAAVVGADQAWCSVSWFGSRPPGDRADGVQRQGVDGRVRVGPGPAVHAGDGLAGFLGSANMSDMGSDSSQGSWSGLGRPKMSPKYAEFDAGHVLDQAEQVGAGRHQGAADVVLGQSLELPEQRLAGVLKVAVQVGFAVGIEHADILAPGYVKAGGRPVRTPGPARRRRTRAPAIAARRGPPGPAWRRSSVGGRPGCFHSWRTPAGY